MQRTRSGSYPSSATWWARSRDAVPNSAHVNRSRSVPGSPIGRSYDMPSNGVLRSRGLRPLRGGRFVSTVLERRHPTDGEAVPDGMVGRFRALVEQLPLSVYIDRLDDVSSNVYTSPQIEQMLGYSVAQWVENHDLFVEILHPEDRERVLAAHQRTHATGEPLFIEYRLRTSDGRYLWVQDEARVVTDAYGPVLQGYLLDITARREAEEQLRHQAFHLSLIHI